MITFEYPYDTPTINVILRNPSVYNSVKIPTMRNINMMADGTIFTTKYEDNVKQLFLTVSQLEQADVINLLAFLEVANNNNIKLTLYGGSIWNVSVESFHKITKGLRSSVTFILRGICMNETIFITTENFIFLTAEDEKLLITEEST